MESGSLIGEEEVGDRAVDDSGDDVCGHGIFISNLRVTLFHEKSVCGPQRDTSTG